MNIFSVMYWLLQQSNLIFSFIMITLGYSQKLWSKYCNYYHSLNKNIRFLSKVWPFSRNILQPFPPKFKLHDTLKYLCIISILFRGSVVSHSAPYSKPQSDILPQKGNSSPPQKCARNNFMVTRIHLKYLMPIKSSAI